MKEDVLGTITRSIVIIGTLIEVGYLANFGGAQVQPLAAGALIATLAAAIGWEFRGRIEKGGAGTATVVPTDAGALMSSSDVAAMVAAWKSTPPATAATTASSPTLITSRVEPFHAPESQP